MIKRKKLTAAVLTAAMLLSLTACAARTPGQGASYPFTRTGEDSSPDPAAEPEPYADPPDGPDLCAIMDETELFPAAGMYSYDGGASVPAYTVQPGLSNLRNLNQYRYGTDDVGDYYFSLELPAAADAYLEQNGFVVLDSQSHREYYSIYERNRYNLVPSFITTDSAVHTFHLMYDYVLKDTERSSLMRHLESLTRNMADVSWRQYQALQGTEFENAALRNAAYFSVAGRLLDDGFAVEDEVAELVNAELALIDAHTGIDESPLINHGQTFDSVAEHYRVDYSQFIPRGHYTQSEELEDYFRATMWYGQITFRSAYPDEVRSALLMTSALQAEEYARDWNTIFQTINFFVGECDDITPADYTRSLLDIYGDGLRSRQAVTDETNFAQALEAVAEMPPPAVNSIPIYQSQDDRDEAITGFRFLGQRFTIDAEIFQRLIDRDVPNRMLPTALDVPAAFGSDEALGILGSDYDVGVYPEYGESLAELRDYVGGLEDGVWTSNLYWSWLNMLRPLAGNPDREGFPFFMQGTAWTRKELNTFLGSWTELKHDTLLYAKQPMAEMGGGGSVEAPPAPDDRGYVEPNPELYGRLALLVRQTREGLGAAGLITAESDEALASLYDIADTLAEISRKELADTALTDGEYDFIRNYGGALEHIWDAAKADELEALVAEYGYVDKQQYLYEHPDALVADVVTDPNGEVLEEATGFAKVVVVAFPRDDGVVLGTGVVFSHYEFTVGLDERMTDEDWYEVLNDVRNPLPVDEWKTAFTLTQ